MRYELKIASRYLLMARRRRHTAFLTLISTLGLGVGVATLIISLALLSGLQGKIKDRLIAASPQLVIEPIGGQAIEDPDAVIRALRGEATASIEPLVSGMAWAATRGGERGRPARVRSFQPEAPPAADVSLGREWSLPHQKGAFITRDFAAAIGVFLGDEIVIVAPRTKLTPFGPAPVWRTFRIARLLPAVIDERAPQLFLPFADAARLFGTAGKPTSIEVFGNPTATIPLQTTLVQKFPRLLIKSWREINRPLFLALRLEKIVMFATISLIIFVAALNLVSSLAMVIVDKRPQVGVLRTLGASERSILGIFLGVGMLIGLGGTLIGNLIGLGVAWSAERYHLIPLPGEMYYLSYLPFSIDLPDVIGVNLVAVTLSIVATIYPARLASRLDPIAAIKEE